MSIVQKAQWLRRCIVTNIARSSRGQMALEYLLLLTVVAVIVIASFGKGSLIDQVQNSSGNYYNSVTAVILDSDGYTTDPVTGKQIDKDNPQPINGGWCPVTCPPVGSAGFNVMYRSCECPPPAFGGAYCSGNLPCGNNQTCVGPEVTCGGVSSCGPCPQGEQCIIPPGQTQAICACADGLTCNGQCCSTPGQNGCPAICTPSFVANCTPQACPQCCSSVNSIPVSDCGSCGCPPNEVIDLTTNTCGYCPTCVLANPQGTQCDVQIDCHTATTNMFCDPKLVPGQKFYDQCQCIAGTSYDPSLNGGTGGCSNPCTPPTSGQCSKINSSGVCGAYNCPSNQQCDVWDAPGSPTYNTCVCPSPIYCWNGTTCVVPVGTPPVCPPCTPNPPCGSSTCGQDSCGTSCGSCPSPTENQKYTQCNNNGGGPNGPPGICGCPEPCPLNSCGTDICGDSCGNCSGGKACNCPGGTCTLTSGSGTCGSNCTPGTCTVTYPCGSDLGIDDNCGGVCIGTANQCPAGLNCDLVGGGQCISGTCTTKYACGPPSTTGTDGQGKTCLLPEGQCSGAYGTCDTNPSDGSGYGQCICTPTCSDPNTPCAACVANSCINPTCDVKTGVCSPIPGHDPQCTDDPCTATAPLQCNGSYGTCDTNTGDGTAYGQCICKSACVDATTPCAACVADNCLSTAGHDPQCSDPCTATAPLACSGAYGTCDEKSSDGTAYGQCICTSACPDPNTSCDACIANGCLGPAGTDPLCGDPCIATNYKCSGTFGTCDPRLGKNGECTQCTFTSCTANCGSTQGTDNCGNPCTTTVAGTTCPYSGQSCQSGQCVCNDPPGHCPIGAVCGPDTCGNQNGCGGPSACSGGTCSASGLCTCPEGECVNAGQCVTPSCGSVSCGKNDICGNLCNGDGTCSGNQICGTSGACVCPPETCRTPSSGNQCVPESCAGVATCGTYDNCNTLCTGNNGGTCSGNKICNASGDCVDCLPTSTCSLNGSCGAGSDGCGGTCTCRSPQVCNSGLCSTCAAGSCLVGGQCVPENCSGVGCGKPDLNCGYPCQNGTCSISGQACNQGVCQCPLGSCPSNDGTQCVPGSCSGIACGSPDNCGNTCTTGCTTTFTVHITDYVSCATCKSVCSKFGLAGSCGGEGDCGSSCSYSSCTLDQSGVGWNCGTCLSETVSPSIPCPNGIASVVSQIINNQTYGSCTAGSTPIPGGADVTYQVVCN